MAAIIASSLLLSFYHACCLDGGFDGQVLSVATNCDVTEAGPAEKSPQPSSGQHACHCLAHSGTLAELSGSSIDLPLFTTLKLAAMRSPPAAELPSPFKPPRA